MDAWDSMLLVPLQRPSAMLEQAGPKLAHVLANARGPETSAAGFPHAGLGPLVPRGFPRHLVLRFESPFSACFRHPSLAYVESARQAALSGVEGL